MIARRLLLDSHALYWTLRDLPELSSCARELIASEDTDVLVSPASFYELMFKANRGRLDPAMLHVADATRDAGFGLSSPSERDWKVAAVLDWTHGDPFDRLLLAQAVGGSMSLVSRDTVFDEISDVRVW